MASVFFLKTFKNPSFIKKLLLLNIGENQCDYKTSTIIRIFYNSIAVTRRELPEMQRDSPPEQQWLSA